ncbi:MAG: LuxR C-terminal-related transcriptional regulator [Dehalococcoidia bacterium]|nr:LuxR C-terminal-related transcriptional regulator [Dehalococcoidia bacterium]
MVECRPTSHDSILVAQRIPAWPAASLAGWLTDVLRVAGGIAEELVISPHTVVRHVSNILANTGSANRTEAARYAS